VEDPLSDSAVEKMCAEMDPTKLAELVAADEKMERAEKRAMADAAILAAVKEREELSDEEDDEVGCAPPSLLCVSSAMTRGGSATPSLPSKAPVIANAEEMARAQEKLKEAKRNPEWVEWVNQTLGARLPASDEGDKWVEWVNQPLGARLPAPNEEGGGATPGLMMCGGGGGGGGDASPMLASKLRDARINVAFSYTQLQQAQAALQEATQHLENAKDAYAWATSGLLATKEFVARR